MTNAVLLAAVHGTAALVAITTAVVFFVMTLLEPVNWLVMVKGAIGNKAERMGAIARELVLLWGQPVSPKASTQIPSATLGHRLPLGSTRLSASRRAGFLSRVKSMPIVSQ